MRRLLGIDFTSAPSKKKPITIARASDEGPELRVERIDEATDFASFEAILDEAGPWIAGCDFPFGLPRAFVDAHAPSDDWVAMVHATTSLDREAFSAITYAAFRAARGNPDAKHRAIDRVAKSHSPLKTMDVERRFCVNPPVGLMFYEGAKRLVAAGVHVPVLRENGDPRVALEAYPALLAREAGERRYKNDPVKRGESLAEARARILDHLTVRRGARPRLALPRALRESILDDASGDRLDAVLCAVQAADASRLPRYGMPVDVDPVEGWIVGVSPEA